jgi:hypothetical protein
LSDKGRIKWNYSFQQKELYESLNNLEQTFVNDANNHFISQEKKKLKENAHAYIQQELNNLKESFLNDLAVNYYSSIEKTKGNIMQVLKGGFMKTEQEANREIAQLYLDYYQVYRNEAKSITENLGIHLKKKQLLNNIFYRFESSFYKDKRGITRNWGRLKEEEIENLFNECKKSVLELISHFQELRITPYDPFASILIIY